ncbi:MAG: alkyl sulfatase dimerization domain-containing protein [Rubrivivax sp.]
MIDPLTYAETAPRWPSCSPASPRLLLLAVIYTHSHVDHFGGVRGVGADEADVKGGEDHRPRRFSWSTRSAKSARRHSSTRRYQVEARRRAARRARALPSTPASARSRDIGGTVTLIAPTQTIDKAIETATSTAWRSSSSHARYRGARDELYLPRERAGMAENATRMMHNIPTPRGAGATPRAGRATSTRACFATATSSWSSCSRSIAGRPGGEAIRTLLADQRDMYAFIHDRTLHLMNQGLTPDEIAEAVQKLPGTLDRQWYARGYYGTLSFNVRAVYQRYLGFYDANPAHLDPLPPVEAGKRYVASMGGAAAVLAAMRGAMGQGDFRWAAQLGNHLVFAEPQNAAAREAQADALEHPPTRANRRSGATCTHRRRRCCVPACRRLRPRHGRPRQGRDAGDVLRVHGHPPRREQGAGQDMTLNWRFDDLDQTFAPTLRNGCRRTAKARRTPRPTPLGAHEQGRGRTASACASSTSPPRR